MATTWEEYKARAAADPLNWQKFTIDANASSNPFLTNGYYSPGPMETYMTTDPNNSANNLFVGQTDNGQLWEHSQAKKNGLDPWLALPFAGAGIGALAGGGFGGAAGAGAGSGGAGLNAAELAMTGGTTAADWAAPAVAGGGGGAASFAGKAGDFLTSKAGGAVVGGLLGGLNSGPDNLTSTSQNKMDPRMDPYIYGENGILSRIMSQLNTPQSPGMANFGTQMDNYVGNWGEGIVDQSQKAAQQLQGSNINAPQVNAPSQNSLNLAPAYQDMIFGAPGANPYLTGAIQKGINQSTNAFGDYLTDSTKATTDLLGNIRGGAVVNGALGGSRQGIAEGRALGDLSTNLTRAATRFGQGNTDAAVAAQAGAYDTDRNRALAAMSGLGAQQYGVAQQNAQLQADTNRLNSANQATGIGLSSGLLGQAYGMGQNADQYDLNKIGKVGGLLGNFTGLNSSTTQSQPLYQNTAGNIIGGMTAGAGLWNMFNQ